MGPSHNLDSTFAALADPTRRAILARLAAGDASVHSEALTKPELLRRWFSGPPGWTPAVCEFDFHVGGAYRYMLAELLATLGSEVRV